MKGTHLTLEERKFIQHGLENEFSKAQIARELGRSPSTVSKEVKNHRIFKLASSYGRSARYALHDSFGFRTDSEFISEKTMKKIFKQVEKS